MLLIVSGMTIGCTTIQPKYDTCEIVLIDTTDPLNTYPTADAIIASVGLSTNRWGGYRVELSTISDKDVNETFLFTLERQNEYSGNIVLRQAQVRTFRNHIKQCLDALHTAATSPRSIIFRAMAKQYSRIAQVSAKRKILTVYSNLYENSEVNFYTPRTLKLLQTNPKSIEAQLTQSTPLPALKGIETWLIYKPKSYTENSFYMTIAGFYEHWFEGRGAKVHIDTQLLPL